MRKSRFLLKADGRWIAFGMLASFFLLLKIAAATLDKPVFELPPFQWFGPMAPYFADLRGVASWSEQFLADPSVQPENLRDLWNRPFNYPHLWLYAGDLGLNARTVMGFGYGMDALFFAAAFFALGRLNAFGGLAAGLFLISYSVMFGVERANVDLLMFVLLALALGLRRFPPLSAAVIALAAVLKLHPVFAFLALVVPPWKKTLPWLGAGLLLSAAGILGHFRELIGGMSSAPNIHSGTLAFGMTAVGFAFMERFHRPELYGAVVISGVVVLIVAAGVGAWSRPELDKTALGERELFAFRLGAGVYLGSFLLGTNHDYRAVVLLFCLPLLLHFLEKRIATAWTRTTLLLILVDVNWLYFATEKAWCVFLVKQAVAWALAVCLTALTVAGLPTALQWPRRVEARPTT